MSCLLVAVVPLAENEKVIVSSSATAPPTRHLQRATEPGVLRFGTPLLERMLTGFFVFV